ncbi:helix-turn-helix domain-containing protein [Streptomyces griseus]
MPKGAAVEEFAGLVRALKARDGRSYEVLGRRLSVSASTLQRHCSGAIVPVLRQLPPTQSTSLRRNNSAAKAKPGI